MVRLGAWSWDINTGEEFKVGAGVAEPYPLTWCAVEYFESNGEILRLLLKVQSPNALHNGRTLLHHAVLCGNHEAVRALLICGADPEIPIRTLQGIELRPIHIAARYGSAEIFEKLIVFDCELDSKTDDGSTALLISTRHKHSDCIKILAVGADFGLVNGLGHSVVSIAESNNWSVGLQEVSLELIRMSIVPYSSNASVFSPLLYVAKVGDVEAMTCLVNARKIFLDYQDDEGFSAAMLAAMVLVYAGADVKLFNKAGDTVVSLSEKNGNRDMIEKVIRNELSQRLVIKGNRVMKYTKGGRGKKHEKGLRMLESGGVLSWGKSRKRNVVCKEVDIGMSQRFRKNRKGKGDGTEVEEGIFRVVTTENKEFHFLVQGGIVGAEICG